MTPNPKQLQGDKKVQLQLVPPAAKIAIANGLVEGAEKYGEWNWRDIPIKVMTYVGALDRHMSAWVEGEDVDPDGDGKTHLEGAIASLSIILDSISCGSAIDDRPKVPNKGVHVSLKHGSNKEVLDSYPSLLAQGAGWDMQEMTVPEGEIFSLTTKVKVDV